MSEYLFHANALGVGGAVMFGGRQSDIPSQAATVLSTGGGRGSARSDGYNDNGVSFSSAETHVAGNEILPGVFQTIAEVQIHNFTVYDQHDFPRLRIGTMYARMTSTRNVDLTEPKFELTLNYDGINVDGNFLDAFVNVELRDAPTFGDVSSILAVPEGAQTITGGLVKGFHPPGDRLMLTSQGCELPIPHVGLARFGEFEFRPGYRRVRMFRLKLQPGGSSGPESLGGDGGFVVAGAVEGNGSPPF